MKAKEITREKLEEIIQQLGEQQKIFHGEAQFQFELAWALQEQCQGDAKVYLEGLVIEELPALDDAASASKKRFYTDIVVADTNGDDYVAIELKYKTNELVCTLGNKQVYLSRQGAQDLGRYDFLYDVVRLQNLKKQTFANIPNNHFVRGLAIMLTNDELYWKKSRQNTGTFMYTDFCIGENDVIPNSKDLIWHNTKKGNSCTDGTWRGNKQDGTNLKLNKEYDLKTAYKWTSYATVQSSEFRFLILDVE